MKKLISFKAVSALMLAIAIVAASAGLALSCEYGNLSAKPWKFGIMSDTQWPNYPDGKNPNVAVNVINHLNQEFINHGVKFVVQVGDLTDNGTNNSLDITATFRQALYNAGIGFYPLRGNHESSKAGAIEFQRIFPQTLTGVNNQTPSDAMIATTIYGPQAITNTAFTVGSNFNSPDKSLAGDLTGLSYAFDYHNARFVLLDQFTPADSLSLNQNPAPNTIDMQQPWINAVLSSKHAGSHAFVFGHKGLITENHADTLFGSDPSVDPAGQNAFISSLFTNGVHYYMGGHDHMHNRAIVTSPDGYSRMQNIILASDSYKFYIPQNPSNDAKYDIPAKGITNGPREMEISQELFTVGYYIVTVDGPRVTVDYYASPNGCNGDCDETYDVIPYTFTKHETFGYSLNGKEFLIAQGQSYANVQDRHDHTFAGILGGFNGSAAKDYAGRPFTKTVDTGWSHRTHGIGSDILTLWGMADLGTEQTDVYTLTLSYDHDSVNDEELKHGLFGMVTKDAQGNWINAVDKNIGGTKKFVYGPWIASDGLGTYGVDTHTHTVWAVINHNSDFAAAKFPEKHKEYWEEREEERHSDGRY